MLIGMKIYEKNVLGRIKFPYMFSCQSILPFVLFGIFKYRNFILIFYCYLDKRTRPTCTCKKLSCKIFCINEKNCFLIVRFRRSKLITIKYLWGKIFYNCIFLDSSLALFTSTFCQKRLVEDAFFWKLDAFFPNFLFFTL